MVSSCPQYITDLTTDTIARSNDGQTLLITSSDGFCSCLTFGTGELGTVYHQPAQPKHVPTHINTAAAASVTCTPTQTPTQPNMPSLPRQQSSQGHAPSPSPFTVNRPASPARSMSASSIATQDTNGLNSQTPQISSVPSLTAANPTGGTLGGMPMFTPPQTPGYTATLAATPSQNAPLSFTGTKREGETTEEGPKEKRRRVAPTLVSETEPATPPAPPAVPSAAAVAAAADPVPAAPEEPTQP